MFSFRRRLLLPRKVVVLPGAGYGQATAMFLGAGWELVDSLDEADLVQFLGGEDVSPALYGEHAHRTTHHNPVRDEKEMEIYNKALVLGIPMAGICRGGQFLNVMNGGKMWQDVDRHAISGVHPAYILGNLVQVNVSSTHHQMMRPNNSPEAECQLLMTAGLSENKESMFDLDMAPLSVSQIGIPKRKEDVEAVYYGSTNCLCFQPHPEFPGPLYDDCRELYFSFIETYLFDVKEEEKAA
jgi:hypothetical protein